MLVPQLMHDKFIKKNTSFFRGTYTILIFRSDQTIYMHTSSQAKGLISVHSERSGPKPLACEDDIQTENTFPLNNYSFIKFLIY